MKTIFKLLLILASASFIISCSGCAGKAGKTSSVYMSYRLEGSYMDYKFFQVDIHGTGKGFITYTAADKLKPGQKEEIKVVSVKILQSQIDAMAALYKELDFMNFQFEDLNKDKVTVEDVGNTALAYCENGKYRKIKYGYIKNKTLAKLTGQFWNIAIDAIPSAPGS